MSFYTGVANKAVLAIKKRGLKMILRRTLPASIDENTGIMGAPTITEHICYGLIQYFDSKASALMYGTNTLKDTLVRKEDQMILLTAAGLPVIPTEVIDALIYDGIIYSVVNTLPLKPAETAILYNVHVRK